MRKRPLLLWACVFVLGLLIGWLMAGELPASAYVIMTVAAAVALACYAALPYLVQHRYKRFWLRICGLALILICGILHMQSQIRFRERELEQIREGADISLCGEIYKKEYRKEQLRIYLKNCYAVSDQTSVACNQVMLDLSSDDYLIGELLLVNGKVHTFSSATNEGGFDERNFYFSQKIDFTVKDLKIERAAEENSGLAGLRVPTSERLWRLRQRISEVYRNAMDQTLAGVLAVMLVGDKSRIDTETKSLYQKAGISHILAISGLHVSLVGMGLYRFFRRRGLKYGTAFGAAFAVILSYAFMSGNGVSTQRAVGMMLLCMLADVLGRGYDLLNALGGVVLLLLWENPFLIGYSGFQFSVTAIFVIGTAGACIPVEAKNGDEYKKAGRGTERKVDEKEGASVAMAGSSGGISDERKMDEKESALVAMAGRSGGISRVMKSNFRSSQNAFDNWNGKIRKLKDTICDWKNKLCGFKAVSGNRQSMLRCINKLYGAFAVWLGTLPLVALYYYEIPTYAALLNMLVLPLMPILFLCGLTGGLVGCVNLPIAKILLIPCTVILQIYEKLAETFLHFPQSNLIVGKPGVFRIFLFYGFFLIIAALWKKKRTSHGLRISGMAALFLLLVFPQKQPQEIVVLDVGQGDGTFLRTKEKAAVFVDGGSSNIKSVGTYRILPFLKAKGVRKIDYWLVSHGDLDHISGLLEVLESGYPVEHLVVSEWAFSNEAETENMQKLLALADQMDTPVLTVAAGDLLQMAETKISFLWPQRESEGTTDTNDNSLVFLYEDEAFRGIFAGDISSETEKALVKTYVEYNSETARSEEHWGQMAQGAEEECMEHVIQGAGEECMEKDVQGEKEGCAEMVMQRTGENCTRKVIQGTEECVEQVSAVTEYQKDKKNLLDVDFYKVNHHGSKYSSCEEWLAALSPKVATISCSRKNSYGHPHEETLERLQEAETIVYRTDEVGAITIRPERAGQAVGTDEKVLNVKGYLE